MATITSHQTCAKLSPMETYVNKVIGRLTGTVQKGRGEGAGFGFKTANLTVPTQELSVDEGVYSAYVKVDGKTYKAAVSVGVSPLFADETTSNVEAHIIDFEDEIYGKEIEIEFVEFLRPMIKFTSIQELISTVKTNINQAKTLPL